MRRTRNGKLMRKYKVYFSFQKLFNDSFTV